MSATPSNPFDFSGDKPRDPVELETALARIEAHKAFDWLWKKGPYSRRGAYAWLSKMLNLPPEKTHMKLFDTATCWLVVSIAQQQRGHIENGV